ncbi:MAG: glycosyltransferase family 2 protein [Pseudanabaenaceae cyanobacterium]
MLLPAAAESWEPLTLTTVAAPRLSIVIPCFNGVAHTYACLRSLQSELKADLPCEVLVADDGSTDGTGERLAQVTGLRYAVNGENLGFLRNVNRAVQRARGEWLVLLNNDVQVGPGWLRALWETVRPTTGAVVSQLVYPNGRLQEAGGILWRDGRATNFGRGDDPQKPEYQFVRPVDYGSAASLLVRRSLWEAIGGFDEIYAPAYYEDADLAMALRQRGYQVLYQPRSLAIHREGATLGTDWQTGGKRHQALNRWRFAVKWAPALQDHYLPEECPSDRLAARRLQGEFLPLVDRGPVRWAQFQAWQREGYALSVWLHGVSAGERDRLQQLGIEVLPNAREFARCLSCYS